VTFDYRKEPEPSTSSSDKTESRSLTWRSYKKREEERMWDENGAAEKDKKAAPAMGKDKRAEKPAAPIETESKVSLYTPIFTLKPISCFFHIM